MTRESARSPEDLAKLFLTRANSGDVEGLVALYEPKAVLMLPDGKLAVGSEAIRKFYAELLAPHPQFSPGIQATPIQNEGIALTSTRLTNGDVTAEIARRQPDGTWLWVVDQPALGKSA